MTSSFRRSENQEDQRWVEKPQHRSRTNPLQNPSGMLATVSAATTIAVYASVRSHQESEAGSSTLPSSVHASSASSPMSSPIPAAPTQ
jgi:hypothetical protein